MNLRFLKKKDGTKILQQQMYGYKQKNSGAYLCYCVPQHDLGNFVMRWVDVEMVEEE